MHDPMTVAFEIRRPWKDRKQSDERFTFYPPIITVWHVDPERGGDDDSCDWFNRGGAPRRLHPRWHFWHWKIQVHPIQNLKRWLFSRCERCGKGFTWGYCPISNQWDGDGPRWFRGERRIFHHECHSAAQKTIVAPDRN